ncbi:MAG TPA: hypothetical protein VEJ18_15185 [Planctomycetota bacterium]|nr:hypothetical protein [Planctomycetota bacterium]
MRILLAILLPVAAAACASEPPRAVQKAQDPERPGAMVLSTSDQRIRTVAWPSAGGRVVEYSLDGENILWTPKGRAGGFQLDIGPEMRQIPKHDAIWSGPYQATPLGRAGLRLSSAPDPGLGLQVVKELGIDPERGTLEVVGKMRNTAQGELSYCFWDRTLCEGGGYALIPVNPKSKFKAGWVRGTRKGPALWEYDGQTPQHPTMKLINGVLVVKTGGPEQKVGTDTMDGWIAYARGKLLYVKYFPTFPTGRYTDGGLTVAHYYNQNLSELEPISPEVALKPGQEYVFPQMWALLPLEKEVGTFEEARALVDRLPKSPFGGK